MSKLTRTQKEKLQKWEGLLGVNVQKEISAFNFSDETQFAAIDKRTLELAKKVLRHPEGNAEELAELVEIFGISAGLGRGLGWRSAEQIDALANEVKNEMNESKQTVKEPVMANKNEKNEDTTAPITETKEVSATLLEQLLEVSAAELTEEDEANCLPSAKAVLEDQGAGYWDGRIAVFSTAISVVAGVAPNVECAYLASRLSEEELESFGLPAEAAKMVRRFCSQFDDFHWANLEMLNGFLGKEARGLFTDSEYAIICNTGSALNDIMESLVQSFVKLTFSADSEELEGLGWVKAFVELDRPQLETLVEVLCNFLEGPEAREFRHRLQNSPGFPELLKKNLSKGRLPEQLSSIFREKDIATGGLLSRFFGKTYTNILSLLDVLVERRERVEGVLLKPVTSNDAEENVVKRDDDIDVILANLQKEFGNDTNNPSEENVVNNQNNQNEENTMNNAANLIERFGNPKTYSDANRKTHAKKSAASVRRICGAMKSVLEKLPKERAKELSNDISLLQKAFDGEIKVDGKMIQLAWINGKLIDLAAEYGVNLEQQKNKSWKASVETTEGADMANEKEDKIVETDNIVAQTEEITAPEGAEGEAEVVVENNVEVLEEGTVEEAKKKNQCVEGNGYVDLLCVKLDDAGNAVNRGLQLKKADQLTENEDPVSQMVMGALSMMSTDKDKFGFQAEYEGNAAAKKFANSFLTISSKMGSGNKGYRHYYMELATKGQPEGVTDAIKTCFHQTIAMMFLTAHKMDVSMLLPEVIANGLAAFGTRSEDKIVSKTIEQLVKSKGRNQTGLFVQINKRRLLLAETEKVQALSKGEKAKLIAYTAIMDEWRRLASENDELIFDTSNGTTKSKTVSSKMLEVIAETLEAGKGTFKDKNGKDQVQNLFVTPKSGTDKVRERMAREFVSAALQYLQVAMDETGSTPLLINETILAVTQTRMAKIRGKFVWYLQVGGYGVVQGLCGALSIVAGVVSAAERLLISGYCYIRSLFAKDGDKETWRGHALRHIKAVGNRLLDIVRRPWNALVSLITGKKEGEEETKNGLLSCEGWRRTKDNGEQEHMAVSVVMAIPRAVYKAGKAICKGIGSLFSFFKKDKAEEKKAVTEQPTAESVATAAAATPATA